MRKLILWNLITLDGMFEGPKSWDLGWHESVWGPELEQLSIEQLRSADMLLFGRVTYQGMAAYWQTAQGEEEVAAFMNNLPKLVFSRTLASADWNNTRLVQHDPVAEVLRLKQEGAGNMFIFGSADLCSTLMKHGLIDEYRLAVTPIVLGSGNPLFKPSPDRVELQLIEARSLGSGGVILRYEPKRKQ
jgi:dihydrofolate reductase